MTLPCMLCGAIGAETVSTHDRHGKPLATVLCTGCGLIRNDPVPSQEELDRFYGIDYRREYKGTSRPRRRQVLRNFRRVESHIARFADIYSRPGRWLDLGAGSGEFSFLARSLGAEVIAVEPNEDYARYCREDLCLDVQTATMEQCSVDGPFHLIRLCHVLEHMRDPLDTLRRLAALMPDDGLIYVEVPNIADEAARKLRGTLFHYGHIHNFDPVTLRHAAGLCGLHEAKDTAARCASRTGVFFSKGNDGMVEPERLLLNAERNRALLSDHSARTVPRPDNASATVRFLVHLKARLTEQVATLHRPAYHSLAKASARRLRHRVAAGGIGANGE